eukprot:CAMPEP_0201574918 /NCGR_PEP_ID=MMETSP0190_2-20130828/19724_1 /ASSEMBLY_ACC=CAM_ASM_000263 /TAXON_ID=37353 /ORGANISM="Rosalina sp." /LENGTH=109 /DNA_ID=CAMNT_0048003827 /DNA_START=45 /DNA_END=374 /DNA_ORIENTATION=+
MTPMDGYDPAIPTEHKENFGDAEMDDLLDEICAGHHNHNHGHNNHMHAAGNPYQMVISHAHHHKNINNNNGGSLLPPQNPYFGGIGAPSFDSMLSITHDSELQFVDYEQ